MTEGVRERRRVSHPVIFLSVATWGLLLFNPGGILGLSHCAVTHSGASPASWRMLLAMNPPASLAMGWALMLVAMMLPTLIEPIRHVLERNFRHRQPRALALFLAGYAMIWMGAGVVLLATQLVLGLLAPESYMPAVVVGLIAFVWQCSPLKQVCLNRNHNHSELAAFGFAADRDALHFGIMHGVWCVGSCWALMLFPMLLPHGHFVGMLAMTFLMISERLDRPRPLSWRLRGPGKLIRIVVAQTRMRLPAVRSRSVPSSAVG